MPPIGQVIKGKRAFLTEDYAQEQLPTSYPVVILSQRRRICAQVVPQKAAKSLCLLSPDVESLFPPVEFL